MTLNKTKALVSIVYFLQGFGIAGLAFSLFLKETLHWSIMDMTLMGTITSIPWFFKIIYGVVSDNYPLFGYRRKSYLIASAILSVSMSVILATVHATSFWFYSGVFFIASLSSCCIDVIIDGFVCQKSTGTKETNNYQNLSWGSRAVGVAFSSYLAGWVVGKFSLYAIFAMMIPIDMLQLPLALLLDEGKIKVKQTVGFLSVLKDNFIKPLKEFVKNKQLMWLSLFTVLAMFSPSFGTPFFFRMRDVLHFDPLFMGLLGSIGSIVEIIACLIFAKYLSNVPLKKLLYVSVFIWAINTAMVLAIVNRPTAIIVNVIGAFTGYISFVPTLSIAAKVCQKTKYEATMFATLMSLHNLSSQGSDLLGSWLYQYTGFFWLVVISTITTFMVLPVINKLEN